MLATKKVTKISSQKTKKEVQAIKVVTKPGSLTVPLVSLAGVQSGNLNLPKKFFGSKVNKTLLSQALRVYSTNQKAHYGQTKSRGDVNLTTAKLFRQKGTGRARHGAKSAPIFVGGGVAFGPKFRKTILTLPQKMKQKALISALSQKIQDGEVLAIENLDKATGKTKQMVKLLLGLDLSSALILHDQKLDLAQRALRNIPKAKFLTTDQLNVYEVIKHQSLLITKAAVERLEKPEKTAPEEKLEMNEKNVIKKRAKTK